MSKIVVSDPRMGSSALHASGLARELSDLRAMQEKLGLNISSLLIPNRMGEIPSSVIDAQIPLTFPMISPTYHPEIIKLQNSVGRLRIVSEESGEKIGSGSAVVINRSGLFITANHVAEDRSIPKIREVFRSRDRLYFLIQKEGTRLYIDFPRIDTGMNNLDGFVLDTYPVEILNLNKDEDLALGRILDVSDQATFPFAEIETQVSGSNEASIKICHISGVPFNCLSEGSVVHASLEDPFTIQNLNRNPFFGESRVRVVKGNRIDSIAGGPGDSGGALFNHDSRLIGVPIFVRYEPLPLEEFSFRQIEYLHREPDIRSYLGSASSVGNIAPYLERILGSDYKTILDGVGSIRRD